MKYIRALACCLAVAVCVATAGCSGGSHVITQHTSRSDSSATSKPYKTNDSLTKEKITLTVWESKDGPDEFIKEAGESFHELYPNITIEYADVELTEAVKELTDKKSTVKKPDTFAAPSDMTGELAANKLILPTGDKSFVNTMALALAREAIIYEDTMYGYPVSCETYALFYNKKFLKESDIPATWENMISWSSGFNALYPEKYGFIFHANTVYYLAMLMSSDGNKLMTGENYGLLNTHSVYGLQLLKQMQDVFPAEITSYEYDDYDNLFLEGNAAMTVNGPWFISKADASGIDYGVTALPGFNSGSNTYSFAGVRAMFVYAESEHPKEADEFARYLLSEDMQKLRVKITETLPATNIDISEKLDGFVDQLQFSYIAPNTPQMTRFWGFGENVCKDIYNGENVTSELKSYVSYLDGTDASDSESSTDKDTENSTHDE